MVIDVDEFEEATAEQIAAKKVLAQNATHPTSWQWNEAAVSYIPPIAYPSDGFPYLWDEATTAWVAFPGFPRS